MNTLTCNYKDVGHFLAKVVIYRVLSFKTHIGTTLMFTDTKSSLAFSELLISGTAGGLDITNT